MAETTNNPETPADDIQSKLPKIKFDEATQARVNSIAAAERRSGETAGYERARAEIAQELADAKKALEAHQTLAKQLEDEANQRSTLQKTVDELSTKLGVATTDLDTARKVAKEKETTLRNTLNDVLIDQQIRDSAPWYNPEVGLGVLKGKATLDANDKVLIDGQPLADVVADMQNPEKGGQFLNLFKNNKVAGGTGTQPTSNWDQRNHSGQSEQQRYQQLLSSPDGVNQYMREREARKRMSR